MQAKVTPADSRGGGETSQRRKHGQPRSTHGEHRENSQWEKQKEHMVGPHMGSTQWNHTGGAHSGTTQGEHIVGVHRRSTQWEHIGETHGGSTQGEYIGRGIGEAHRGRGRNGGVYRGIT